MDKHIELLILETIEASDLNEQEKEDIRRELESHFYEKNKELMLQGGSDSEIVRQMAKSFGNTKRIGQNLYFVHRKLEKIPFIGILIYYPPIMNGMRLLFFNILTFIGYMFLSFFIGYGFSFISRSSSDGVSPSITLLGLTIGALIPLIVCIFLEGRWLQKRVTSKIEFFETVIISLFPVVILFLYLFFNGVIGLITYKSKTMLEYPLLILIILIVYMIIISIGALIRKKH